MAPYREVAHLIAMDRYCDLMGVGSPHDLPASYAKGNIEKFSVSATRIQEKPYKRSGLRNGGTQPPLHAMSPPFTAAEVVQICGLPYQP